MKKVLRILASVIILLIISMPVMAAETDTPAPTPSPATEGNGIILGQMINATAGGGSVADQQVNLHILFQNAVKDTKVGKTDADGKFSFNNLPTDSSYSYGMTAVYQNVQYYSDVITFAAGQTSVSADIQVYDATIASDAINIPTAHTIISVEGGVLNIMEFYLVSNPTDETYVGSGKTMSFPLPEGADNVQYGGDLIASEVVAEQGGFADTSPVYPDDYFGGKQAFYSYQVSFTGDIYQLSQKVFAPIATLDVLAQGIEISVPGGKLTKVDPVNLNGTEYNRFSGTDFKTGDTFTVNLSGLSKAGSAAASTGVDNRIPLIAGVGGVVVAAAGITIFMLKRKKGLTPVKVSSHETEVVTGETQDRLLDEIAQLDDAFENGKIEETEYRQQRAVKKARLVKIMGLKGGGAG